MSRQSGARRSVLGVIGLAMALVVLHGAAFGMPDYRDWMVVSDAAGDGLSDDLAAMLMHASVTGAPLYILVPPTLGEPKTLPDEAPGSPNDNWLVLDNRGGPFEINRDLYLHGGSPRATRIVPLDPSEPLFRLGAASKLNIAGLTFTVGRTSTTGEWCSRGAACDAPCECDPYCESVFDPMTGESECGCGGLGQLYPPDYRPFEFCVDPEFLGLRCAPNPNFEFEMFDSLLDGVVFAADGPGKYHIQGTVVLNNGLVQNPVLIDHEDADVTLVGVDFGSPRKRNLYPGYVGEIALAGSSHQVRQKEGRLRMYAGGVSATFGHADVRIDTPASGGPHILAGVRSEGRDDVPASSPSSFLFVPPSAQPVDVVIKGVSGAWEECWENDDACYCDTEELIGRSYFVNYNAAGTVWLLGNTAPNAGRLVVGDTSSAHIYAIGNQTRGATEGGVANLYHWAGVSNCLKTGSTFDCAPEYRFSDPLSTIATTYPEMPPPPKDADGVPDPLTRPAMSAIPRNLGMIDASRCQGPTDDDRLQLALHCSMYATAAAMPQICRDDCRIPDPYYPGMVHVPGKSGGGSWQVDRPLEWFHPEELFDLAYVDAGDQSCYQDLDLSSSVTVQINACALERWHGASFPSQGTGSVQTALWLAGSGSGTSVIENTTTQVDPNDWSAQSVFRSAGSHGVIIQGVTFKAPAYGFSGGVEVVSGPTVHFEYARRTFEYLSQHLGAQDFDPPPATQDNYFHDAIFDGGKYAFGLALQTASQSDAFVFARSKFRNAKYGLAIRGNNALAVVVTDPNSTSAPTFLNNYIAMGNAESPEALPCCCSPSLSSECAPKCVYSNGQTSPPVCIPGGTPNVGLAPNVPPPAWESTFPYLTAAEELMIETLPNGGSWYVMGATSRGTILRDLAGSDDSPQYYWEFDTTTEQFHGRCDVGSSNALRFAFLDQPQLGALESTATNRSFLEFRNTGGLFVLYPTVNAARPLRPVQFNNGTTSGYAINIFEGVDNRLWEPLTHQGCDTVIEHPSTGIFDHYRAEEWNYETCLDHTDCGGGGAGACSAETCEMAADGHKYCRVSASVGPDACRAPVCVVGVGEVAQDQDQVCVERGDGGGSPGCLRSDCDSVSNSCTDTPLTQTEGLCLVTEPGTDLPICGASPICGPAIFVSDYTAWVDPQAGPVACETKMTDGETPAFGVLAKLRDCVDGVDCYTATCECQPALCDNGLFCDGLETCGVNAQGAPACVPGSDPCLGLGCDELADECVPTCPSTNFCDGVPPVAGTSIGDLCELPDGGFFGCPDGQTLHSSTSSDCDGGSGTSIYCFKAP